MVVVILSSYYPAYNSCIFVGADLFKDKTADLKNQTLRVVAFSHIPGTVKSNFFLNNTVHSYIESDQNYSFSGSEIEVSIYFVLGLYDKSFRFLIIE